MRRKGVSGRFLLRERATEYLLSRIRSSHVELRQPHCVGKSPLFVICISSFLQAVCEAEKYRYYRVRELQPWSIPVLPIMASQTLLAKSKQNDSVLMRLRSSKWFLAASVGGALFTASLVEQYSLNHNTHTVFRTPSSTGWWE